MPRRTCSIALVAVAAVALVTAAPALASVSPDALVGSSATGSTKSFPTRIGLPDGFQPEGIATGRGSSFYAGSQRSGAIYKGDLVTGEGKILVPGQEGRAANGLKVDRRNRIFVAGLTTGKATVYDAATGDLLADYQVGPAGEAFLNDVVVTRDAAYFTDSLRPVIYVVPFGRNGELPGRESVRTLPLTGDFMQQNNAEFCPQGPAFNANGIEASPDGRKLIMVQLNTGLLFSINASTGATSTIDLDGARLSCGDGLLLRGHTLYAVQNYPNKVAVVHLGRQFTSGKLIRTISDPALDVPATIAAFGPYLYAVNGRFSTPPEPDTQYDVIRLPAT